MTKEYSFNYNSYEAEAKFKVDTETFTEEIAKQTLGFFTWDYNKDANPIDEVLKKYAMQAIRIATSTNYNEYGVKREFEELEGFCSVDGSMGIELLSVEKYEFDEDALEVKVKEA